MPIIPTGRTKRKDSLEELRKRFNETQPTIKEKRIANLVKAREAKKKKNA